MYLRLHRFRLVVLRFKDNIFVSDMAECTTQGPLSTLHCKSTGTKVSGPGRRSYSWQANDQWEECLWLCSQRLGPGDVACLLCLTSRAHRYNLCDQRKRGSLCEHGSWAAWCRGERAAKGEAPQKTVVIVSVTACFVSLLFLINVFFSICFNSLPVQSLWSSFKNLFLYWKEPFYINKIFHMHIFLSIFLPMGSSLLNHLTLSQLLWNL